MKTLAALRQKVHTLQERLIRKVLDLPGIVVTAKEHPGPCKICQGPMHVQKTFQHEGRTIAHGTFDVQETVWVCAAKCRHPSGKLVTRRANYVVQCIMPNSITGYDLMVSVGRKRYLEHRQREEIRAELREKHAIQISSGEVTRLAWRFLDYLTRLHYSRAEQLKAVLKNDGGWPMHIDATGENGRGTLLVVMAGWKKWVLGSWKIATERSDLIVPCLQDIVRRFGSPCAAMRDMGRAVTPAIDALVRELDIDIPVLTCHQHFLADIGKDLLEPSHSELRALFRRTKILPKTRSLVRDLGRHIGEQIEQARKAVQVWQSAAEANHRLPQGPDGLAVVRSMAQWTLDYKADATGLDFPFDRPYLDLYNRCKTVLRAIDAFLRVPPADQQVLGAIKRLQRILASVSCEVPFLQITRRLHRRAVLFDELRDKLRLASRLPENESEDDLNTIREDFDKWIAELEKRRPERGPSEDIRNAIDIILEHADTHGDNLWGHAIVLPEYAGGGIRLLARTNELLENFFKEIKHSERRRSGRKNLTQDLEHLPASAALAYNLKDADYVRIVCGSLDNLAETFAQLDQEEQRRRQNGLASTENKDLERVLQLSTSSLSTADRRIVRTDAMNRRIEIAAKSRAPRFNIGG
ncbi:MAG: hypothetical protein GY845_01740 [Planctomycetes bacterium]|nr:hypothetical protein [Planctomycetota bacterium]